MCAQVRTGAAEAEEAYKVMADVVMAHMTQVALVAEAEEARKVAAHKADEAQTCV